MTSLARVLRSRTLLCAVTGIAAVFAAELAVPDRARAGEPSVLDKLERNLGKDIAVDEAGEIWLKIGPHSKVRRWKSRYWKALLEDGDASTSSSEPDRIALWDRFGDRNGRDIAIGADGKVWMIGHNRITYRWDRIYWRAIAGGPQELTIGRGGQPRLKRGGERIAAGPNGKTFVIDVQHNIWQVSGAELAPFPGGGKARDIAIGANDSLWIVDPNGKVYYWHIDVWSRIKGNGKRIAVGPEGAPYLIDNQDRVRAWDGESFVLFPGGMKALDIDVGGGGDLWIVGTNGYPYHWDGHRWIRYENPATGISVGPAGNPYIIGADGTVLSMNALRPSGRGTTSR